jgi:RNA polymerase sigma factor (sigma-70 family)
MASANLSEVVHRLRGFELLREAAGATDAQLLESFVRQRDEAAFEALVRRHGPMVLGVCRRVLRHRHDAEDAFQATFLVLVRKAAAIGSRQLLANWLYGVAYNIAIKARATLGKRRGREKQVSEMPEPAAPPDSDRDLLALLDQELSRLPDKYRVPIVLCDLEGKGHKDSARQLGWPVGTFSGRLSRARTMLAKRLVRRGVALSAGSLTAVLAKGTASAGVTNSVVTATVEAASVVAAGNAAAGVVSARVAALAEGVLKTMLLTKLKAAAATLLVLSLFACGGGLLLLHAAAAADAPAPANVPDKNDKKPDVACDEPSAMVCSTRDFKIPVSVRPDVRAELKELTLLMSEDEGKTWQKVAFLSSDEGFIVHVPKDGLYWFTVQLVKKDGTAEPHDLRGPLKPELKVRVKTDADEKPAPPADPPPALGRPAEEGEDDYQNALAAAVHHFIDAGELRLLRATLAKHPKLINVTASETYRKGHKPSHDDYHTPLYRAVEWGDVEMVAFLLDAGADVNRGSAGGWTPLHLAASYGRLEIVKRLVKAGAKVDATTTALPERIPPSSSAVGNPGPLLPAVPSRTPLQLAEEGKHADVLKYLKSVKK